MWRTHALPGFADAPARRARGRGVGPPDGRAAGPGDGPGSLARIGLDHAIKAERGAIWEPAVTMEAGATVREAVAKIAR